MGKSDTTVLTVVANDNGLFDLMIRSVYKFTNPAPQIIVCDQSGQKGMLKKYENDKNITIVTNKPKGEGGSNRHGEGLNKIFPLVTTKKTAIIESDCILLCKDWDVIDFPRHKVMAAKKYEMNGIPFYHVCFIVFSTGLLRHGGDIDFRAGRDSTNRSYKPHEDVGWRIYEKVRQDEVGVIDFKDCKEGTGFYFGNTLQSSEFWVGDRPTVAHFGRGSHIGGKAIRKGFAHPAEQLEEWKKIAEEILK
jgi:hypothetical protein